MPPDDADVHLTSTHTLSSSHLTTSPSVPSWNWPFILSHEGMESNSSHFNFLPPPKIENPLNQIFKEGLFPKYVKVFKPNFQLKTNPNEC